MGVERDRMPCLESRRISEMGLLCSFLVVFVHCAFGLERESTAWWFYRYIGSGVAKIAVPFFFVVSGYFLGKHVGEENWWRREIWKRLKSLLIPFLIWSILYAIELSTISAIENVRQGRSWWQGLLTASRIGATLGVVPWQWPALVPLWYIRALLLFVLVSVCLDAMTRRIHAFVIVACLIMGIVLGAVPHPGSLVLIFTKFFSLWGFSFYMFGAWLARWNTKLHMPRKIYVILLLLGMLALIVSVQSCACCEVMASILHSLSVLFLLAGTWGLWPGISIMSRYSRLSFPIYVMHLFFITFVRKCMWSSSGSTIPTMLMLFLAGSLGATATCSMLRKFAPELCRHMFGGR